jgi:NTE family protein
VGGAYSIRNTVVNGRLRYTGSPRGALPPYNAATLGGFRNLSAFTRGQILGDDMAYASLGFEQIVGTFPIGIQGDIRLGLLLEAATVGNFYTETNLAKYEYLGSAAIYLGGNTPIGPAYVGFGYSPQGSKNLFLSIGLP